MSKIRGAATGDLLSRAGRSDPRVEALAEGATLLREFATPEVATLLEALKQVLEAAPFRHRCRINLTFRKAL